MIKAIIFDCFGVVLTDSLAQMCDELADTNSEKAKEAEDLVRALTKGFLTTQEGDEALSKLFGISHQEFVRRKYGGETRNTKLLEYIKELRKDYKTAMLTNIGNGGLMRRFKLGELQEYFDVVVASGEIGFAKPEPQAYEITAEKLGVRLDECVFTDDRPEFCEAAQHVGMKAIPYGSFAQLQTDLQAILAADSKH